MQDNLFITIMFNRETLTSTAIFYNGATDTETAKLEEIAYRMFGAVKANAMKKLWSIVKRMPLKFRLWRLEKKIGRGWDRGLSLQIDQILNRLEGGQP